MRHIMQLKTAAFLLLAGFLAAGCAGTPTPPPILEQARNNYQAVRNDPQVVRYAPLELQRAEQLLNEAENLWREDADEQKVRHVAYLSAQRAAIAREKANLEVAQQAVDQFSEQRTQILLQSRTQEAERARQLAEQRGRELQQMGERTAAIEQQATEAQQKTAELQQQLQQQRIQAEQTRRGLVVTLDELLFDFNEAEVKPGAERTLAELVDFLRANPDRTVRVEGFTDAVGSADYNLDLSRKRAQAVKEKLTQMGIAENRIITEGYGESYPIATNETTAGRQLNRRVEIVISTGEERVSVR